MKKLTAVLILITLTVTGCKKNDYDAPGCIQDKIDAFKTSVECDNDSYVALYSFNDKDVYVFSEGSCGADLGATVYSSDCLYLGFLGGITGNTFIQGVNFYNNARYIKRIWEN